MVTRPNFSLPTDQSCFLLLPPCSPLASPKQTAVAAAPRLPRSLAPSSASAAPGSPAPASRLRPCLPPLGLAERARSGAGGRPVGLRPSFVSGMEGGGLLAALPSRATSGLRRGERPEEPRWASATPPDLRAGGASRVGRRAASGGLSPRGASGGLRGGGRPHLAPPRRRLQGGQARRRGGGEAVLGRGGSATAGLPG